ncbi:MAG: ABC transporter permease [Bryobacteraceae bacterium]
MERLFRFIEGIAQDFGFAVRTLSKAPGFTAVVVLSVTLGIGANTAIFSLIDAVMWRMLPVKNPETLLAVVRSRSGKVQNGFTYKEYKALREYGQMAELTAYSPTRLNVSVDGSLEPTIDGQMIAGNYFSLLGVNAIAGRAIDLEDDRVPNGHPVAMISHGYWRRRFGLDPTTIGRTISISGTPFTIVGVVPPEFFGVEVGTAPDIFVPMMMQPTVEPALENLLANPIIMRTWCLTLARLKPGVYSQQAAAALEAVYRQITPRVPDSAKMAGFGDWNIALNPAATGLSALRLQFSQALFILMAVVGVVLLIACANTANLLLARAAGRRPEFAMRLALGASRGRVIRQLVVESLVLAMLGGACGILLARWATMLLTVYMSAGRSAIALDLNPDLRILSFTAAVSVVTGLLFGLAPALRSTRIDLAPALKGLGNSLSVRGGLRPGKILAVLQVALSLQLIIAAGLFVRSLRNLNGPETGSREGVLIIRVEPRGSDQRNIPGASQRLDGIYRELIRRVEPIPGVRSVGMSQVTPTRPNANAASMIRFASGESAGVGVLMTYPSYFATAGIPVVAGREFNSGDLGESSPAVCIVNEAFVRAVFPGENPIGKACVITNRPRMRDLTEPRYDPTPVPYEIVGVVEDSRFMNPTGSIQPVMYMTFLQTGTGRGQMVLYVRVSGNPNLIVQQVRAEVWKVDPKLPQFEIHTLAQEMDAALIRERLIATLSSLFGALALLLACVGLYGLLAFAVVQRTGEVGIRMALGASRGDVLWMMLREALLLTLGGLTIGVPLAIAAGRVASSKESGLLFGLRATDPLTVAGAAALLVLVSCVAAYLPARRASHVDPMVALRNE